MPNNLRQIYMDYQKEHGRLSVNQVAIRTGVSNNTLQRWIDDPSQPAQRPNKRIVRELCAFFGVDRRELLGEENAD